MAEKRYRPDELAKALGICVETVRYRCRRGEIRHIHVFGQIRIPEGEFHRLTSEGTGEPLQRTLRKHT